ncbi:MAG TPA: pitrilysin family protein, partial [Candidatus Limnocylindria bacterium]|nr:pitrilysin family protein [Candidatus Limnocylindria bacterium]
MIARPPAGAPRTYHFPDVVRHTLPNGLGVWFVPLPERELVSVHLLTDAGAAAEDEPEAGVAALTAQLLVTGTRSLDAAAFAETTERLGIEVGSESTWDSARAGFTALGTHLDAGLELLADMIVAPRLDAGEFDRLKAERLNDILQARSEPGRLADERFLAEVYADGVPYGRLSAGRPETLEPQTVDSVRAFHASRYAPNVADIVVSGAFDPDGALAAIERNLG